MKKFIAGVLVGSLAGSAITSGLIIGAALNSESIRAGMVDALARKLTTFLYGELNRPSSGHRHMTYQQNYRTNLSKDPS